MTTATASGYRAFTLSLVTLSLVTLWPGLGCDTTAARGYAAAAVERGRATDAGRGQDAAADRAPDAGADSAADSDLDADAGPATDGDVDEGAAEAGTDAELTVCAPPPSSACPNPPPSFANDVMPILLNRCDGCHDPNNPSGPWPFQGYDDAAAWASLIQSDLLDCTMPPPDSGITLPTAERYRILSWLDCGIPNN